MATSDALILEDYSWRSYTGTPDSLKLKVEASLLSEIVASSGGELEDEYPSSRACIKLLSANPTLRKTLLFCWRKGDFSEIRNAGLLRKRGDVGRSNPVLPIGTKKVANLNVYGGTFTEVHGNLIDPSSPNPDAIKRWLCPLDYTPIHKDISSGRTQGTGTWFLRAPTFSKWIKEATSQILWCPGMPGVGKTFISSLVVDHLERNTRLRVCVIYLSYKRQAGQTFSHILSTMLRQLYERDAARAQAILDLYSTCASNKSYPSDTELCDVLGRTISEMNGAYLILDALDEYSAKYSHRLVQDLMSRLQRISSRLKIMVTSRILGNMDRIFHDLGALRLGIQSMGYDIEACLFSRIATELPAVASHSKIIVEKIMKVADERFLLAQLHLNSISRLLTWGEIRDSLDRLPTQIDVAYEQLLGRINEQEQHLRELAYRILMWVACTRRSLSLKELQHALAIAPGREHLEDYAPPLDTIAGVCAGLVVMDEKNGVVRFIHHTAQEFFERSREAYFPNADTIVTNTYFLYLSPLTFRDIPYLTLDRHPFARYIASYGIGHLRDCEEQILPDSEALVNHRENLYRAIMLSDTLRKQFPHDERDLDCSVLLYDLWSSQSSFGSPEDDIRLIAGLDLPHSLRMLLEPSQTPLIQKRDKSRPSILEFAIQCAAPRTSMILLEISNTGGTLTDTDRNYALKYSSLSGLPNVVNKLLEHPNTDVNRKDRWNMTPLMAACLRGDTSIVETLLRRGNIDLDARHAFGYTALDIALRFCGREHEIVRMLARGSGIQADDGGKTSIVPESQGMEDRLKVHRGRDRVVR